MDFTRKKPKAAYLNFQFLKNIIKKTLNIAMGDFLNVNWGFNRNIGITMFVILITFVGYINQAYMTRCNFDEQMLVICLITFDIIGVQCMLDISLKHELYFDLITKIEEYVKVYEQTEEGYKILLWYLKLLKTLVVAIVCFVIGLGGIGAFSPIFILVITGRMEYTLSCFMPFISHETYFGFVVHVLIHGSAYFEFIPSVCSMFTTIVLIMGICCAQVDILKNHLKNLTNQLMASDDVKHTLYDIVRKHQQMLKIVDDYETVMSSLQLTCHIILGFQICFALFISSIQFWPPTIIVCGLAISILFPGNLLGTIFEFKLDSLSQAAYDVPWHLMNINTRREFVFFYANTQNTQRLSIGGRAFLSLETYARFCNGIYSYLMFLRGVHQ